MIGMMNHKNKKVVEARGLILRADSTLAERIINSMKFQNFIKRSLPKLLNGDIVSGSLNFKDFSTLNIGATLGNADILKTYINKNGDIVSFVLDTYDFNPGENLYIAIPRDVQEHGLLNGYFSITILVVPQEQWLSWIIK